MAAVVTAHPTSVDRTIIDKMTIADHRMAALRLPRVPGTQDRGARTAHPVVAPRADTLPAIPRFGRRQVMAGRRRTSGDRPMAVNTVAARHRTAKDKRTLRTVDTAEPLEGGTGKINMVLNPTTQRRTPLRPLDRLSMRTMVTLLFTTTGDRSGAGMVVEVVVATNRRTTTRPGNNTTITSSNSGVEAATCKATRSPRDLRGRFTRHISSNSNKVRHSGLRLEAIWGGRETLGDNAGWWTLLSIEQRRASYQSR